MVPSRRGRSRAARRVLPPPPPSLPQQPPSSPQQPPSPVVHHEMDGRGPATAATWIQTERTEPHGAMCPNTHQTDILALDSDTPPRGSLLSHDIDTDTDSADSAPEAAATDSELAVTPVAATLSSSSSSPSSLPSQIPEPQLTANSRRLRSHSTGNIIVDIPSHPNTFAFLQEQEWALRVNKPKQLKQPRRRRSASVNSPPSAQHSDLHPIRRRVRSPGHKAQRNSAWPTCHEACPAPLDLVPVSPSPPRPDPLFPLLPLPQLSSTTSCPASLASQNTDPSMTTSHLPTSHTGLRCVSAICPHTRRRQSRETR